MILIACRQIRLRHSLPQLAPEPNLESKQAYAPAMRRQSLPGYAINSMLHPSCLTQSHSQLLPPPPGALTLRGSVGKCVHPSGPPTQHLLPLDLCHSPLFPSSYHPHHRHFYSQADSITWFLRTDAFAVVHLLAHPPRRNHGRLLGLLSYATLLSSPPHPLNNNSNNNNKA